jgi:topoisomerase-4 subunit B
MRLIPVSIGSFHEIKPTLEFYMGKNTPKRKQFIMENLINEDEADMKQIADLKLGVQS